MNDEKWDLRRLAENAKKTVDENWSPWMREQAHFAGTNRSPRAPIRTEELGTDSQAISTEGDQ